MPLISLLYKIRLSNNLFSTEVVELLSRIVPYRDNKSSSGAKVFSQLKYLKSHASVRSCVRSESIMRPYQFPISIRYYKPYKMLSY